MVAPSKLKFSPMAPMGTSIASEVGWITYSRSESDELCAWHEQSPE